jgi:hypothetical protein
MTIIHQGRPMAYSRRAKAHKHSTITIEYSWMPLPAPLAFDQPVTGPLESLVVLG